MKKLVLILLFLGSALQLSAQNEIAGTYQIKFLEINKANSDYAVAMLDDNKIVFTSEGIKAVSAKKNYNPRKELFIGDINFEGEILNIKPVTKKENNKYNTTGIAYTKDLKMVFFSRNKYVRKLSKQKLSKNKRLELFKADVDAEGNWTNIQKLSFNDDKYSTGYPTLNRDNTKLYFASDRLPSMGGMDIFVVDILNDGTFSSPRNLGNNINTPGNETTPYITDKNVLYFSSDGHEGMGNLDIYAAEVFDNYASNAYHLESPINSINDDFAYIIDKTNTRGFFTSNRLQGNDNNDLYAFTFETKKEKNCYITVEGLVKDKESQELLEGAEVNLYKLDGTLIESISTTDNGTYNFEVPCNSEYKLVASTDNYEEKEQRIEILDHNTHRSLHSNLNLQRIIDIIDEVNNDDIIKVSPIFFDFDKYSIRSDSRPELDKIVRLMKDNPKVNVEAAAYTDSRGTRSYNKALSQRRANAAVKYIISRGVDAKRIKAIGYGEEKLLNHCVDHVKCTEEQHQQNRRTEFTIINAQAFNNKEGWEEKNNTIVVAENAPVKKEIKKQAQHDEPFVVNNLVKSVERKVNTEKEQDRKSIPDKSVEIARAAPKQVIAKKETAKVVEISPVRKPEIKKTDQVVVDFDIPEPAKKTVRVKQEEDPAIKNVTTAEMNYKPAPKTNNKADNYLEEQKIKVLKKLVILEKKFVRAGKENRSLEDSFMEEYEKITEFKEEVKENTKVGWSNIIQYNNQVISYNKTYMRLIDEANRNKQNIMNSRKENEKQIKNSMSSSSAVDNCLKVKNVEVIAMRKNNNGRYGITKNAKKTDMIKVSFRLVHNDQIKAGAKEAHIVIVDPEGKVTNARGVFLRKDLNKEDKYTDHTVLNYENYDMDVEMFIERKGHELEKGVYPVKLFLEGQFVGESNLDLASGF